MSNLYQQAVEAFKVGDKQKAKSLLEELIKSEPNNAEALLGLSMCSDTFQKKKFYLESVLAINPNYPKAREMLDKLTKAGSPKRSKLAIWLIIGSCVIVVLVLLFVIFTSMSGNLSPKANATQISMVTPSETEYIITDTSLPPTWTPVTPTMTYTIIPSDTTTITFVPTPTIPTAMPILTGKWQITTKVNPLDDSITNTIFLNAEAEITAWLSTSLPLLVIRCQQKELDVYVNVGTQQYVESGNIGRSTVQIRFDKNDPFTLQTDHSTDGNALFFEDPKSILQKMVYSQTMVFGFTPFNASPVTTIFDLRGLNVAIKPVENDCNSPY